METYNSDVLSYYKLKQTYQHNIDMKKYSINQNKTLSSSEKRERLKNIVKKCVNCKKNGGTLFDESNGMLKAKCNSDTPCDLNINIKRKFFNNALDLSKTYDKQSENLKMRIIITKLDYLFGINNSKEDIIEKFNILKVDLSNIGEKQILLNKDYGDIISGIHRNPLLNDATIDLENEIYEMKQLYKEYLEKPSNIYIENMIELYINKIKPIAEEIRKMKYEYYKIEEIDNEYILFSDPYFKSKLDKEI